MTKYRLKPVDQLEISQDDIASILEGDGLEDAFMKGEGDTTYICGNCDHPIVESVSEGQIQGVGFICPSCEKTLYIPRH